MMTVENPEVQYALFCSEVIEKEGAKGEEITFKGVLHELFVPNPGDIEITLVLRLLNVPKGEHKIDINCMLIPDLKLVQYHLDKISLDKDNNCFITQELRVPVTTSNEYIFTILFDESPLKRLKLPIHVFYTH